MQLGLVRLLELFPLSGDFAAERKEYNRITQSAFERIRDFQSAFYVLNRYGDSEFWSAARRASTRRRSSTNTCHSLRASPMRRPGISGEKAMRRSVVVSVPPPGCS